MPWLTLEGQALSGTPPARSQRGEERSTFTSLELIPIPKIDTAKGDDNIRDAPSETEGITKITIVMRRCPT
eukprot:3552618-Pyramimonas_sp.AAC.1